MDGALQPDLDGPCAGDLRVAASPLLVKPTAQDSYGPSSADSPHFLIGAPSLPIDFASVSLHGVLAASRKFDLLNVPGIPSSARTYLLPVSALALGF